MKRDEAKRLHAIQAREDIWARREHFFTRWSEAHAYDTCAKCGVVAPSKGHCTGVLRPGGPLRPEPVKRTPPQARVSAEAAAELQQLRLERAEQVETLRRLLGGVA